MSVFYYIQRDPGGTLLRGYYSADQMPVTFVVDFPPPGNWTYSIQAYGDGTENVLEAEILGMVIKL